MSDLQNQLDMFNHWIARVGSGYAKARLQVLRDEVLYAFDYPTVDRGLH